MIDVLIIGAGMYVCGKGTNEYGTILPAVMQAKKDKYINKILVAATSIESIKSLNSKIDKLNTIMGTNIKIDCYPKNRDDFFSYREALEKLGHNSCVILAVPDHLHYKIASEVIIRKKHILVVKPLVPNVEEAKKLIKLQKSNNILGEVEFHKRYDLANLKGKKIIMDKTIGDLLYIVVEYSQKKIIPEKIFKKWIDNTNIFQYLGIHYVDMIYFSTRAIPLRVSAVGQKNWLINKEINTYDSIETMIEWKDKGGKKFISVFALNWVDPNNSSAMSYQSIKYIGTKGRYESDQKDRGNQLVTDKCGVEDINPYFTQIYPVSDSYEEFRGYGIDSITNFIKKCSKITNGEISIAEIQKNSPTFDEALISTAVNEAVKSSLLENGTWKDVTGIL